MGRVPDDVAREISREVSYAFKLLGVGFVVGVAWRVVTAILAGVLEIH